MGCIFKPKYRDKGGTIKESSIWWIKYYRHGRPYRESAKSEKETEARKLLKLREGFLEHSQYLALIEKLPEYLKPVLAFGYTYGWRHAEIINLTWDKVDLRNGVVRLEPGTTKNKEGRTVYLDEEMLAMFRKLFSQRRLNINRVFLRDGEPIQRFDKAWKKACRVSGLKGTLFHDLRRTAIRNLVRSGVPQTVCMAISGHKTPSVFQRYDITSDRDLQEAMLKRSTYIQGQGQDATVKVSGKVTPFQQKEVNANVR
jgi:integrase